MSLAPGTYFIKNSKTGTMFDLSWVEEQNHPIHGYSKNAEGDQANQMWFVQPSNDLYLLKSVGAGLYAHVSGDRIGRPLHGSVDPTKWRLEQDGNECYIIYPNSNLAANLKDGMADNATPIQLRDKNCNPQQKWVFEKFNGDYGTL